MKTILLILVSMTFIQSAKAEEPFPYQVYLIKDNAKNYMVMVAIDSGFQLMYYVMKMPGVDEWVTYRENNFESGGNVQYFNKERFAFSLNLDTFLVESNTTNFGYSMTIKRKNLTVPFDDMGHAVTVIPNNMGLVASFLCKDISVLPHTVKEMIDFGPEKIMELIEKKKVFLKNIRSADKNKNEAAPVPVP